MTPDGILEGRPIALYVLDYGLFRVHAGARDIGICGFLIRTDAGENVLVDTGLPEKYTTDPEGAAAEDGVDRFGKVLSCTRRNLPDVQIATAGVAPHDVTLMVQTHTHVDHIGHIGAFPNARMLIGAAERDLPRPLYWGETQPLDWPQRSYLRLEKDAALGPGLLALLVPGHTPGQIALMVDLPKTGPVMLTSDAISRPEELADGFDGAWDAGAAAQSAARLMDLAEARDATIIFGHCPAQWRELRKAPDGYF